MSTPSVDAHVRLDTHPTHPSAVIATLTGFQAHIPHVGLEADGWHVAADNVLVLASIDHEESQWRSQADWPQGSRPRPAHATPNHPTARTVRAQRVDGRGCVGARTQDR